MDLTCRTNSHHALSDSSLSVPQAVEASLIEGNIALIVDNSFVPYGSDFRMLHGNDMAVSPHCPFKVDSGKAQMTNIVLGLSLAIIHAYLLYAFMNIAPT